MDRDRFEASLFAASYRIQDGKIETGAKQPVAGADNGPGKVDTLEIKKAYERAERLAAQTKGKVFKSSITPHWFLNNTHFWYRNDLRDGTKEFILVDVQKGARKPAFDHAKLAAALSKAAGVDTTKDRLPFDSVEFADGVRKVLFRAAGKNWQCDLTTYECTPAPRAPQVPDAPPLAPPSQGRENNAEPADDDADDDALPVADDVAPQQKKFGKGKGKFGTGGAIQLLICVSSVFICGSSALSCGRSV